MLPGSSGWRCWGSGNYPCPLPCLGVLVWPAGEALGVQGWVQTLNSQMVPDPLGHLGPKCVPEGPGEHEVLVKKPWSKF